MRDRADAKATGVLSRAAVLAVFDIPAVKTIDAAIGFGNVTPLGVSARKGRSETMVFRRDGD
jgi:hypothetical protein